MQVSAVALTAVATWLAWAGLGSAGAQNEDPVDVLTNQYYAAHPERVFIECEIFATGPGYVVETIVTGNQRIRGAKAFKFIVRDTKPTTYGGIRGPACPPGRTIQYRAFQQDDHGRMHANSRVLTITQGTNDAINRRVSLPLKHAYRCIPGRRVRRALLKAREAGHYGDQSGKAVRVTAIEKC